MTSKTAIHSPREPIGALQPLRRAQPPSLTRMQRRIDLPARWALAALAAWVLWRTAELGWTGPWLMALGLYVLVALATTAYWAGHSSERDHRRLSLAITYASYAIDGFLASLLIWRDGGLGSPLYILYVLLALRSVGPSMIYPRIVWLPFAFGPLYALALWMASDSLAFFTDASFLSRYLLLWAWLVGIVLVATELSRRTRQALELDAALGQQQRALAQKTEVLQKTATDLGDRVLELRSLQEVAKALATTLRTEETLQLVVEELYDVTGSSNCAVALIDRDSPQAAREGAALDGMAVSDDGQGRFFRVALSSEPATEQAARLGRPVHIINGNGTVAALLGDHPFFVTALVSRGHAIGVLYVAEHAGGGSRPGLDVSEQLLTSFAYFAATALENARLFQDAWEKRRELEAVLAGIGDGVVVAGTDLSLVLLNPVARAILALENEPPAGVPLRPYLDTPSFTDLLAKTLQSGQEQIAELDLPDEAAKSEREARTYGALASPLLDAAGGVSGVVAVLRDITAQKELERMKSNFLSVVSHELRTPLHSIKGFVEIILMGKTGPVTEIQEDFLKTVRAQTTVLQRMIDDLLEFSRMEAGRAKLALADLSVVALAHTVATKLAPLAEEAGLHLGVDVPANLPEIDGDRMRLEQVLTNLVENAIKFTPDGGAVTISAAQMGDRMRLTVSDTGIGIPAEEQEKVFDRFYQVDATERRAYRGTALGLSICRHIVERHNGRIWVESTGVAGAGSTFQVDLPIELRPAEAPTIDFTTPAKSR
jgi:two-component system, NtrC family, sensor histidine kinase KinB